MGTFSERYGYVKPCDAVIKESMPEQVSNAVSSLFFQLIEGLGPMPRTHSLFLDLEKDVWWHFLNKTIYSYDGLNSVICPYINNQQVEWYKKLDLIEYVLNWFKTTPSTRINLMVKHDELVISLNREFERLHYGYRIVDSLVTPITSQEETVAIENALLASKDNVKEHLRKAISLFADRESPDYANSIKESISAVEALCRELTGKNTLGEALKELSYRGIKFEGRLKAGIEQLYAYTNQPDTGVRHALMGVKPDYAPSYNEAYFMLVVCSAFINYINGLVSTTFPSRKYK